MFLYFSGKGFLFFWRFMQLVQSPVPGDQGWAVPWPATTLSTESAIIIACHAMWRRKLFALLSYLSEEEFLCLKAAPALYVTFVPSFSISWLYWTFIGHFLDHNLNKVMHICRSTTSISLPLTLMFVLLFRAAPMRSGKFVTSSLQPGQIMGSPNTPHLSWLSCAGWRPATLQTPVPWSSTAGVFFASSYLCHLAIYPPVAAPQMTTADRRGNRIQLLHCMRAISRKHMKFFLAVSEFFLLFFFGF